MSIIEKRLIADAEQVADAKVEQVLGKCLGDLSRLLDAKDAEIVEQIRLQLKVMKDTVITRAKDVAGERAIADLYFKLTNRY